MIKRITRRQRSRRAVIRGFLRWFFYSLLLLFLYVCEVAPLIRGWCPLLIIPLATSVAMFEGELAAGVFAVFCGLLLDVASGTLPGFSSILLLICCPFISLLSRYVLRATWFSHAVMNAITAVFMGGMDFLLVHWVWEREQSGVTLMRSVLPAYAWAIVFCVPVYFLVRLISAKFRPKEERKLDEAAAESANEEEITKGEK